MKHDHSEVFSLCNFAYQDLRCSLVLVDITELRVLNYVSPANISCGFVGGGLVASAVVVREREGTVVVKVASAGLECWTGGLGGSGELVMVAAAEVWACGCCCLGVTAMVTSEVWAPTIAVVAAGLPAEVLKIEED
nr:hypothetical protein Iba_chr14dCG5270 [Ipomoea batatas]